MEQNIKLKGPLGLMHYIDLFQNMLNGSHTVSHNQCPFFNVMN